MAEDAKPRSWDLDVQGRRSAEALRLVLLLELAARKEANPRYSLRAFARDLGVAASTLSEALSGRHRLSRRSIGIVTVRLVEKSRIGLRVDTVDELVLVAGTDSERHEPAANVALSEPVS